MNAGNWKSCGSNVVIYPLAKILRPENIVLGSNIIIDDFVFIGVQQELILGNHVHISSHASITGGGKCVVADFCCISSGARVLTGTDDFTGGGLTNSTIPLELRHVRRQTVVIESHAMIGVNAVILPGLRIGEGATVGAGSVVTKDLEPWTVHAGVPARPLRMRDRDSVIRSERRLYETYGTLARSYRLPA